MANQISLQSSINTTVNNINVSGRASVSQTTVSPNAIAQTLDVTSSVWTAISLGELDNVMALWVQNDNTTGTASVITIATGSAGQNVLSVLSSGHASLIAWSGSLNGLYAKITSGSIDGRLQVVAQQA